MLDLDENESDGDDVTTETVELEDASLLIPDDATDAEAAAIAVAVGAHLTDRQQAAASASADAEPDPVDRWKLHGRLRKSGKRRYPRDVERGEEWKAAARSFYR